MGLRTFLCSALGLALLASAPARADVALAGLFGDHMVLPRNARAHLWGTAAPGELIRVRPSWYENDAAVTAGPDGRFELALSTPAEPGPHTIRLRARNELVLEDVWLGEVWLASGQSNMEMGVAPANASYTGVREWEQELAAADRPRIRCFTVRNTAAAAPVAGVQGAWRVATPESVRDFSAAAWFFAKELERELDCPVGIVAADWGGTPAQAWTSARALAEFPRFAPALADCAAYARDPAQPAAVHEVARGVWGREVAKRDPLSAAHAERAEFDDATWATCELPGLLEGELAQFDGVVWLRRAVDVPAGWAGRELELRLGAVDDDERTWFDGELCGATDGWDVPRRYKLDGRRVRGGRAVVAVRVYDSGGACGVRAGSGELALALADGSQSVALAGAWRFARGAALAELPPKPARFELRGDTPSALFNGMIAPLAGFRFAGAIWYQGEGNVGRAEEYARLFPALIRDWRSHFESELPFLFVQIAPFAYGSGDAAGDLRAAQARALELSGTGMVVTLDAGDPADIHPKQKQVVGRRLAALALERVYGRPAAEPPAPAALEARREGEGVVVRFDRADVATCGPSAFEVAGPDGAFHPAQQVDSAGGAEVHLRCPGIQEPRGVRYAWAAAAAPSVRSSGTSLPIAPFRLDVR